MVTLHTDLLLGRVAGKVEVARQLEEVSGGMEMKESRETLFGVAEKCRHPCI